jgi:hypothetical protein
MASSWRRSEILSLFLLAALIDGEHAGEEMLMTCQCAGVDRTAEISSIASSLVSM